jgi:hypothetical protein
MLLQDRICSRPYGSVITREQAITRLWHTQCVQRPDRDRGRELVPSKIFQRFHSVDELIVELDNLLPNDIIWHWVWKVLPELLE